MRTDSPSLYSTTGSNYFRIYENGGNSHTFTTMAINSQKSSRGISLNCEGSLNSSAEAGFVWTNNASAKVGLDTEL